MLVGASRGMAGSGPAERWSGLARQVPARRVTARHGPIGLKAERAQRMFTRTWRDRTWRVTAEHGRARLGTARRVSARQVVVRQGTFNGHSREDNAHGCREAERHGPHRAHPDDEPA